MNIEALATQWFVIYYALLGICLIGAGSFLILNTERATNFLTQAAENKKPPTLLIRILKYFLLFTLPGLGLSFFPFSWVEILFSIWSLLLVFIAGLQLVRWDQNRALIKSHPEHLPEAIHRSGAIMVAVGFSIFLLAYLVINRAPF